MTQILDLEGGFSFKMRCDRRGGVPAGDLQTVYRSGAIGSKGVKRGGRGGSEERWEGGVSICFLGISCPTLLYQTTLYVEGLVIAGHEFDSFYVIA